MEQNLAILIADLSGYTALTETHGAESAADIIDKYLFMVNESLTGTSILHERVGDEVLVLAESADDLLATAETLSERLAEENQFLQLHGGMHYGKLLKRGTGYFGSALNATARIASSSNAGTILCSNEFRESLNTLSYYKLKARGSARFKNLSTELELYELNKSNSSHIYIDPICRMIISSTEEAYMFEENTEVRFCSKGCLDKYSKKLAFQN